MLIYLKKVSKEHKEIIFLCILSFFYFLFMLRYYLIDYYVPDFRSYFARAFGGRKASDGFSSLFLWFSALAASMPQLLTALCLILMTLSILHISIFMVCLFKNKSFYFYTCLILLYSSGIWYYFYGKLFYDFPFTAYTYSLCLLVLRRLLQEKDIKIGKEWFFLCGLLGLCFSWKPYNIFCITGLGLLMLGKQETRDIIIEVVTSARTILLSLLFFVGGYVIGNYNLLIDPVSTIDGIKAYEASYSFKVFLHGKSRIVWDHVNDLPFRLSVTALSVAIIVLYVIPILCKKIWYFVTAIFMTICFYFYIEYFSPGYAWHGLTMGLFIVTFVCFLLSDMEETQGFRLKKVLLGVAIFIQCFVCFGYYIPLQNSWYETTENAIDILETKENDIYMDVMYLIDEVGDSYYLVDEAIKRYKPVPIAPTAWKSMDLQNTYYAASNYEFVDPLKASNYNEWNEITKQEKFTTDKEVYEYVIWIIPNCFKRMSNVANIHLYDEYNIIDKVCRDGYTVYLYKVR